MKNMPGKKSVVSLALGSAFVAALGVSSGANAGENPFVAQPLAKGYMVAHADGDRGYGKSGEGRCGMAMADTDKDGRVSAEEHARHCQMMFEKMDTNNDGYIDKDEAENWRKMHGHRHGYKSRERAGYSSSESNYDQPRRGYSEYGERSGDRFLPHMKPMGE